jgi:hypothetical protein
LLEVLPVLLADHWKETFSTMMRTCRDLCFFGLPLLLRELIFPDFKPKKWDKGRVSRAWIGSGQVPLREKVVFAPEG